MVRRTRYNTIPPSKVVTDTASQPYPDPLLFPINDFVISERGQEYNVTQGDIDRWDLLINTIYGTSDYDDIVLWLNNKGAPYELTPGEIIILPLKADIERFYTRFRRS